MTEKVASREIFNLDPTGRYPDNRNDKLSALGAVVFFRVPSLKGPAIVGSTRVQRDITLARVDYVVEYPATPHRISKKSS
jgi:hypothetical protein